MTDETDPKVVPSAPPGVFNQSLNDKPPVGPLAQLPR